MGTEYTPKAISLTTDFFESVFGIDAGRDSLKHEWFRLGRAIDCADVISAAIHSATETGNTEYLDLFARKLVIMLYERDCGDILMRIQTVMEEKGDGIS